MPFYKWRAYDIHAVPVGMPIRDLPNLDLKYQEGVMECSRFELVVMELAKRDLVAKEVSIIEYEEYRKLKRIEDTVNRLSNLKTKLQPRSSRPLKPKRTINWTIMILIILAAVVVGLLLFHHYQ